MLNELNKPSGVKQTQYDQQTTKFSITMSNELNNTYYNTTNNKQRCTPMKT